MLKKITFPPTFPAYLGAILDFVTVLYNGADLIFNNLQGHKSTLNRDFHRRKSIIKKAQFDV